MAADNIAAMISASNWMMRAWETGNEAEYRALTTPDFRMVVILAPCTSIIKSNCFVLMHSDS